MAYLEERVIAYVCSDPHLFVAEQRPVRYGPNKDKDYWWADVLIADPWKQRFYLEEATYDSRPHRLSTKLKLFAEQKAYILNQIGGDALAGWDIRPWLFVRKDSVPFIVGRLPAGLNPRITYLEYTSHPWEYQKVRMAGLEPKRPYDGLDPRFQD